MTFFMLSQLTGNFSKKFYRPNPVDWDIHAISCNPSMKYKYLVLKSSIYLDDSSSINHPVSVHYKWNPQILSWVIILNFSNLISEGQVKRTRQGVVPVETRMVKVLSPARRSNTLEIKVTQHLKETRMLSVWEPTACFQQFHTQSKCMKLKPFYLGDLDQVTTKYREIQTKSLLLMSILKFWLFSFHDLDPMTLVLKPDLD